MRADLHVAAAPPPKLHGTTLIGWRHAELDRHREEAALLPRRNQGGKHATTRHFQ